MKPKTDKSKSTFLKIPAELACRPDLSWTAKAVAAQLMAHGRKSSPIFPSQDLLCAELGIENEPSKKKQKKQPANRTIRRAIKSLEKSGDFRTRREGNRRNNRYFPSQLLARIFDYQGETADSLTGQSDQSEADTASGQKRHSEWSKTARTTGQKRSERLAKNGRVTGQVDPLIDNINISIETKKCNTNINMDPDQEFELDSEDFNFVLDSNADANAMVSSNKVRTGEWSK